ncbi:MAG TPA: aminoglycoside phosphotransferase family protein, partial [Chloroflexota bacterium]
MADLKFETIHEASKPHEFQRSLAEIFPGSRRKLSLETTRLSAPTCHWAVYQWGPQRLTFKSFFEESDFDQYVGQLDRYYPQQLNDLDHPRGGFVLLPELNGIVWSFPFDPAMPGLHYSANVDWVASVLGEKSEIVPKIVNYTPEVGSVLSYRVAGERQTLAYGKVTPHNVAGLQWLIMQRLWCSPAREAGVLNVAQPLAFRPEAGLLLQSAVPGKPIPADRNRTPFLDLVDQAGATLAAVHGADIPFGSERSLESLVEHVRKAMEDLKFMAPRLYPEVRKFLNQVEDRAGRSRPSPLVPSHGDYKYDQLLYSRGTYSLIDFEMFCQAEPALDLGTFCAYLPPSVAEDWRDGAATETLRTSFLASYENSTGEPIDLDRLALYESAMLALRGLSY